QRARELSGKGAISVEVLDNRRAQEQQASARVASVSAALDRAQLDLDYTRVTAPIDGRVSNARITAGNYVHTGQTELTRIVSTDKMYAYFDVDERTFLKYAQMTAAGTQPDNRHDQSLVYMFLADDGTQPYVGSIDFVDN